MRQARLGAGEQALTTLSRVDYQDAFLTDVGSVRRRTGEQWARAVLEGAPPGIRKALRAGWATLGLQLGPTAATELVLGWEVRRRTEDLALLGASSPLGLHGEVLFKREQRALLFATFVQLDNPAARAAWAGIAPGHREVVRYLLEQAARREHRRRRTWRPGPRPHPWA